ncbi:hypothetical protein PABG_11644 [Paracoccidioides brasiliensis Pb03]|uniref:Uncharacterized protein n=1 Tax=Paracoccidioides brasiliensis (strain Pb18) TaxID=502780 RepID=A0A0A0HTA4_PARBD|nr:uncharacterized protein PADG_11260 [Paracoccidioides brasiliensis Pb18]KGM92444.1 hypothetical protein PADG_11260 [Paracoccidioides brasiliensis Pb18]KGY15344.1 hypothetical protein PABG_11644 [Paracoccidioides brasiliensis Pb03]ODH52287.1 hypothetical protein GX48_01605 [Paracoccidioides brasiliensis]
MAFNSHHRRARGDETKRDAQGYQEERKRRIGLLYIETSSIAYNKRCKENTGIKKLPGRTDDLEFSWDTGRLLQSPTWHNQRGDEVGNQMTQAAQPNDPKG